jgi:hypothetical protein
MTKPDPLFKNFRPDEIAECWEGVSNKAYRELWNLMPLLPKPPTLEELEDRGPEPAEGKTSLAYYWNRLSPEVQTHLNRLAEELVRSWVSTL